MDWFIVDGHEDVAMTLLLDEGRDFGAPVPEDRGLSLPDARRGELGVILATVFAPEGYWKGRSAMAAAREQLRLYEGLLDKHAEHLFRVESRGDLALCRAGGPIGMVHLVEGADPIASPDALGWWVDQGVRVVGLAWNTPNRYSGGTNDDQGVSAAGRDLLDTMHEHGVLCDVSHLNRRAVDDVLLSAKGPVVASHSNADAVYPHRRNLVDEHIRAIAEREGIVCVVLYDGFLRNGKAALSDVIAHIDHFVSIAGPEHVGIGSDIDGGFGTHKVPDGIDSVADLKRIGEALLQRGYSEKDARGILGENWMRVLREALPA